MPTALIVDDSRALARGVAAMLESAGYETHVVLGGLNALAFLQKSPIDVMVLDLQMPGTSGLDVLRSLRDSPAPPGVPTLPPPPPIIVFSLQDGSRDEALRLGAVAYVSKSNPEALLLLVQQHAPLAKLSNA